MYASVLFVGDKVLLIRELFFLWDRLLEPNEAGGKFLRGLSRLETTPPGL